MADVVGGAVDGKENAVFCAIYHWFLLCLGFNIMTIAF